MVPLLLFDRSRLVKLCDNVKVSIDGEQMEMITARLLRSHLEEAISDISTNNTFTNVCSNGNPTPRVFTHSFGKTVFKNYLITNTIHIIVQVIQVIAVSILLNLKADLTDLSFIESGILPQRTICLIFSNNMGQQNTDIYQCTLSSQYRIGRTFILLICYTIIIICCNIICLIQSIRSFVSRSRREKLWLPYCHAQCVIQLDDVQARQFVDYIGCDGHYIFTILQNHTNRIAFQRFFQRFVEFTFAGTH